MCPVILSETQESQKHKVYCQTLRFTQGDAFFCHSERSEESQKRTSKFATRPFVSLRVTPFSVILSVAKNLKTTKFTARPSAMLRVTIQIADDRRQMADFGSSRTADPYSVILSETQESQAGPTKRDSSSLRSSE